MKVSELKAKRKAKVDEMRSLAAIETRGEALNADQLKRFGEIKVELEQIESQIERASLVEEAERRMAGATISGTGDDRLDSELAGFSLRRAIISQTPDLVGKVDCGREIELSAEIAKRSGRSFQGMAVPLSVFNQRVEQRVFTTTNPGGGPGSNVIATDLYGAQFIDRLRNAMRVKQLGATVLNGLVGNVDIPRLKASATSGWVAENAAISASDPQVDKVSLTPKHVGALTEYSRNMLMQSTPAIENLLADDFAKILAEAVDLAAIKGGGSNEPTGVLATSGIGSVAIGTNGGPITWASVIDLIATVDVANAQGTAFLTNSKVVKSGRKIQKVSSTDSVMIIDAPDELAGYPLATTNLVPSNLTKGTSSGVCSALIFGNWADLILGYWSEFDLLVNPYESTACSKGNVQVRGMVTMSVNVRHAESFGAIQDLTTP
jgi:HK97 family phage major capsid protein